MIEPILVCFYAPQCTWEGKMLSFSAWAVMKTAIWKMAITGLILWRTILRAYTTPDSAVFNEPQVHSASGSMMMTISTNVVVPFATIKITTMYNII